MATQRYFPAGYFAAGYFNPNYFAGATLAPAGSYFHPRYFAPRYFANGYFASGSTRPPQLYFHPRYFAVGYFAAGYFGGVAAVAGHSTGAIALSLDGLTSGASGTFFKATFNGVVASGLDDLSASIVATTAQLEVFDISVSVTPTGHSTEFPGFAGSVNLAMDDLGGAFAGTFRAVGAIDGQLGETLDGTTGALTGTHVGPAGRLGSIPNVTLDDIVATNWVGAVAAPGSNFGVVSAIMDDLTAQLVGTQRIPSRTGTLVSQLDDLGGAIIGLSAASSVRIGKVGVTMDDVACDMRGIGPKFKKAAPQRIVSDGGRSGQRVIKARSIH